MVPTPDFSLHVPHRVAVEADTALFRLAEVQEPTASSRFQRPMRSDDRSSANTDRQLFFPSASAPEAIARIFALTGRTPDDTRGEKRALVALRDALGLDVEVARTNAVLAKALADALNVDWAPSRHTERNRVTLEGLNALLEGAVESRRVGSLARLQSAAPKGLNGSAWAAYRPARSKIEAVTRIAALTNAPREFLGPGSKEHKSVFLNLADALFPDDDRINKLSKTRLGASLAVALNVPWDDACESTGETISLAGLNSILAGAERHLGLLGSEVADVLRSPEEEGSALTAALLDGLPGHWDGRKSVTWLASQGLRGASDNEWQGFYGEEKAKAVLNKAFTPKADPPRVRYGNTSFDYSLNSVWDIKVHTEVQLLNGVERPAGNETQLNDETATRLCIAEQGLGFLAISGAATMDETGEFVAWHRTFKGKPAQPSNSGQSRTRKAAFRPLFVEAFWVEDTLALEAAILAGQLKVRPQGRQAPRMPGGEGIPRANKFEMQMRRARSGIRVARHDWPT
ncbi:MAG: hypothetical protein JWP14_371 [Frankiales bacterium]|nr:hypothetical protein [Frankiales bacterium]